MARFKEFVSRLETRPRNVARARDRIELIDQTTLKREYRLPAGFSPQRDGVVTLIQHGDFSGAKDWPKAPDVLYSTLTGRYIVQPNEISAPISAVKAASDRHNLKVLVRGLDLVSVSASGKSKVEVQTDSAPMVSTKGKGKVVVRAIS